MATELPNNSMTTVGNPPHTNSRGNCREIITNGTYNGIIKNTGPLEQAKRGPERRGREDDVTPLEMNAIPNSKTHVA